MPVTQTSPKHLPFSSPSPEHPFFLLDYARLEALSLPGGHIPPPGIQGSVPVISNLCLIPPFPVCTALMKDVRIYPCWAKPWESCTAWGGGGRGWRPGGLELCRSQVTQPEVKKGNEMRDHSREPSECPGETEENSGGFHRGIRHRVGLSGWPVQGQELNFGDP